MSTIPSLAIDPFDESFLADPYAYHDQLRDTGPVIWLESIGVYGIARYAEVKAALQDHEAFCSGRGVGLSDFSKETPWRPPSLLLEADPPLHSRTRKLMDQVVSLADIRAQRPKWLETAQQLVERLIEQRQVDAVADIGEALPMLLFPDLIGVPKEGRELLPLYGAAVFNAFGPQNAIFKAGNDAATEATKWVADACKRENLTKDGWGAAVYKAADNGECTTEEAERLVRSFLSAGVDTTINGISQLILGLASDPSQWQLLREDPKKARKAFEESLRWDSTAQTFFRTTSREVEIGGVTLPEGAKVLLFLGAANRDPRHWTSPDRFDVTRLASGHVGFGFGIHQCLGQMVARQESEVLLEALIPRVKSITLRGQPVRRLNNTLHALESLPIELDPA